MRSGPQEAGLERSLTPSHRPSVLHKTQQRGGPEGQPEGNRTETLAPPPEEQGAEEWRGKGRGSSRGRGADFVSGNKNSNPASTKP